MTQASLNSAALREDAASMEASGATVAVIATGAGHDLIIKGTGPIRITNEGITVSLGDAAFVVMPTEWVEMDYNCGIVKRDEQQSEYHVTRIDAILIKLLWRH